MAATKYTRSLASDFVRFDAPLFISQVAASSIIPVLAQIKKLGDVIDCWFFDPLSTADETTFDGLVALHGLSIAKVDKVAAVDEKTHELIHAGFTFSAKQFSLSEGAQLNLLGINMTRDDAAMTYPITYNTKDDAETLDLADATDVHNFYLTALGAKRGHLDSGTALKDSIRAATTIAAVDAVVDDR